MAMVFNKSTHSVNNIRFLGNKAAPLTTQNPKLIQHYEEFSLYLKQGTEEFMVRWECENLQSPLGYNDFELIRTIGIGGFGRVMLAARKTNKIEVFYAIKIFEKRAVVMHKQVRTVMQELRILNAIDFVFLANMLFFYRNNCYLFCVMPLVPGGELFTLLRQYGHFDESASKIYAAQVILAFEYLHANGIVYRDLKPENIVIDMEGFLKVIDCGFCKRIGSKRTWTLCGTPEYLAPEVILTQGYNFSVDWWTLGIFIFEMVSGRTPFYVNDTMKLYNRIVQCKYRMPDRFSEKLKHLISNLIQVDRDKRFGMLRNGVKDIKGHEWFKDIEWQRILRRQITPWHVPPKQPPRENTNFEKFDETTLRQSNEDEFADVFSWIHIISATTK